MSAKLAISNIAWPNDLRQVAYQRLKIAGFNGVEIALTKFSSWDDIDEKILSFEKELIADAGLLVSSYQAIYFNRPDLQLLGSDFLFSNFSDHTRFIAKLAHYFSDGGIAVLGAPKNRVRGNLTEAEAFRIGKHRLRHLAEITAEFNFILCLEAAPPSYGGDFLVNIDQCADMVAAVDHSGLRLHMDTGCIELDGLNVLDIAKKYNSLIAHVHISKPHLAVFNSDDCGIYGNLLEYFTKIDYLGWTSVEMRESFDPLVSIFNARNALI